MTIIDWGLVGVFFISLMLLTFFIVRRIPQLVIIDLETIAKEREARVRERLLRERIRRQFAHFFQWKPIHALTHRMDRFAHYLETNGHAVSHAAEGGGAHTETLLEQALTALREKRYAVAEEFALAIIRHDPQHARAYALLGKAKLAAHAYSDARDALQFAVRRMEKEIATGFISERDDKSAGEQVTHPDDRELARLRCDLAGVLQETGDTAGALEQLESATLTLPNDPKVLDALLSLAVLVQKKELAEETLEQLRAVNPENEKLASLTEKVAAMVSLKRTKRK